MAHFKTEVDGGTLKIYYDSKGSTLLSMKKEN